MTRMPRWSRRLIAAILAAGLGVATAAITYQVSVQPGAAIVASVFDANALVTPPADFAAIRDTVTPQRRVAVRTEGAPTAHLDLYRPRSGGDHLPMVLWVHGGGFISSSSATVDDYAIMLAAEGYVVASLDYSLAPATEHPAPVRQAAAALRYLAEHAEELGGDADSVLIGGDSAGAQIASETAAAETNTTLARGDAIGDVVPLKGVILFCGLYDLTTVGSTGFPALRTYLWAYTGYRDWLSYPASDNLSTVGQVTSAYPPTFISVGDADPFSSQASELASSLRSRSVPVDTLFWTGTGDGLGHEYQFDFTRPQARTAFQHVTAFLSQETR